MIALPRRAFHALTPVLALVALAAFTLAFALAPAAGASFSAVSGA